jgi:hypothetical protein
MTLVGAREPRATVTDQPMTITDRQSVTRKMGIEKFFDSIICFEKSCSAEIAIMYKGLLKIIEI